MTQDQIINYLVETINELKREMEVMKQQMHETNLLTAISSPVLSQEQKQSAYLEYMQIQQQKETKEELARSFK